MRDKYADVIVDIPTQKLDRIFQYIIPEDLNEDPVPGMVAEVPFGANDRLVQAYIVGTGNETAYDPQKLKPIRRILTDGANAKAELVALAVWMKQRYGCTALQALRTVLPARAKVQPKEDLLVELACSEEEAQLALFRLRHRNQKARARLLEALIDQHVLPWSLVREKLNITLPVRKALEESKLVRTRSQQVYRNPVFPPMTADQKPVMNEEQQLAVDTILGDLDRECPGSYLLHGVTGSGKTLVYMELIEGIIARGKQAIVLIPEIALTYQTLMRFYRRFADRVSVINSRMSPGERYDQFLRSQRGEIDVMIGPRSALFTPFPNLGIIVIDEEHEPAYISESMPRYSSREVASYRAQMDGAVLVLGSATPSVESYYAARQGDLTLLEMRQRATGSELAKVCVADLREELRSGNRSVFSRMLKEKMESTLQDGGQVMLFLNRRGYAGFVSCRSCGHVVKCPHCDVAMSYHNAGKLICHYCGYEKAWDPVCPECGASALRMFRAGTEQIEQEAAKLFPQARVLRMDADTTKQKDSYTRILSAFADHEADILIGTQMIVKGHDFPDVSLVGILAADMSLYAPDYRAAERTFQLLTQAAGRAGRASRPGEVVIQTYDPDHYSILCAAAQDYRAFYEKEIEYRLLAGYPPAGALTGIHISGEDPALLETACGYLQRYAKRVSQPLKVAVLGPVDEPIAKIQDVYRKVMYLKAPDAGAVRKAREKLQQYIDVNEGFRTLTIQYKVE